MRVDAWFSMPTFPLARRNRISIFEFVGMLKEGDPLAWIALAAIAACVAFFALYEKVTGQSFVKSKRERRAARRRRKHVVWEFERDED